MITIEQKETGALLSFLAYELFEKEIAEDLNGIDWHVFLKMATEHAVTPLLYSGVNQVSDVPQGVFDIIERFAVRSTILSDRMSKSQNELFECLNRYNIKAAVIKGTSVAAFYRHPEVRMTGDIDILIAPEDMSACSGALSDSGFIHCGTTDIHTSFKKERVTVEVHGKVTRYPDTPKGEYASRYMLGALNELSTHSMGKYDYPMLRDPYHLASLLLHMERHIGASGIGLKQLCDWAVAVKAVDPENISEIKEELNNCGLLHFSGVLTGVCEKYLGMPKCEWMPEASDELIDELMAEILSVGNFQAQYRNRPLASAMIDPYDLDGDGKRKLLKTYLRSVKRKMKSESPWAKSPLWVPLFAVRYFVKWIFSLIKGDINLSGMINSFKTAKSREKLLRKMRLYK